MAARIKPALRSANSASPNNLTAYQGPLYFTIVNERGTRELWLTRDLETWPLDAVNQELLGVGTIERIHVRNDVLYLEARNARRQSSFWQLEPRTERITNVEAIPPLEESPALRGLISKENYAALVPKALRSDQWARTNGKVFFVAHTPRHGAEMWVLDEQFPEPFLLCDIVSGPASSSLKASSPPAPMSTFGRNT